VVDSKHIVMHLDEEKPDGVINESIQQVGFEAGSKCLPMCCSVVGGRTSG